jgi:hypothetical protein
MPLESAVQAADQPATSLLEVIVHPKSVLPWNLNFSLGVYDMGYTLQISLNKNIQT